jgi:uncharacterized protein (TIGR03084 family)
VTGTVVDILVRDLAAEKQDLAVLLAGCPEDAWQAGTPAPEWTVHDQIAHLAHFDGVTRLAMTDPAGFAELRAGVGDLQAYVDGIGATAAHRDGHAMLDWWNVENAGLRRAALAIDPAARVPWFGPSMSVASKLTARIMETWAHGQDVVDALGLHRPATGRLQHVARIGVLALPNSFRTHGLDVPTSPVRVDLVAPDGRTHWSWGPDDAADRVAGPAADFCLVVTQRRHLADTALEVAGTVADRWLRIAQAFAGPPGDGRRPGQFRPATGARADSFGTG